VARETDLIILDGCTFLSSDESGDVGAHEAEGFFYQDVRHLSRWQVRVNGKEVDPLTSPIGYSTVTVLARLRGWSTLSPRRRAMR
jgi:N-terminal domain of (some) glycogen debranching enzymes